MRHARFAPPALALLILVYSCGVAFAQSGATIKDELGVTRMQASWPEDGAVIDDPQPVIAADASRLESPLDPQTVAVAFNGRDVTAAADVTAAYVLYQPPAPLPPGRYDVRITASDVNKNPIEPLAWSFTVSSAQGEPAAPPTPKTDNTVGRFAWSSDYVAADSGATPGLDVSQLFREKEGMKLNTDLSFTNISQGRTLSGTFHRETRTYTDIEEDKGRLEYRDDNFSASMGHFRFRISDLTVAGTELAGARISTTRGPWDLTAFSGRSQDPSTSGTFHQLTSGLSGAYHWNTKHATTLTTLTAYEKSDQVYSQTQTPARDEIASLLHEFRPNPNVVATLETAANMRREQGGAATHNGAIRFAVAAKVRKITAQVEAYAIDQDFLPIAEGSARTLLNNRRGVMARATWHMSGMFTVGGEIEGFETTDSTRVGTTRSQAHISLRRGMLVPLTFRTARLTTDTGLKSESNSVTATLALPGAGALRNSRLTAGWQNIDYEATDALTDTSIMFVVLNTWYKSTFGLTASFSNSETNNMRSATTTETDNLALNLTWNVIPARLTWTGHYSLLENTDTTMDNREERAESTFRYTVNNMYTVTVAYGAVAYDNAVTPQYNYNQRIVRAGMEMDF